MMFVFFFLFLSTALADEIDFVHTVGGLPAHRGVYSAPFQLTVKATRGCFRLSQDGTLPLAASNLPEQNAPLNMEIDKTMSFLAAPCDAIDQRNVTARTYLFASSLLSQTNSPPNMPLRWGGAGGRVADYQFLPDPALNLADYEAGLKSLPIIALTLPGDDFGSETTGAYRSSSPGGIAWERATAVEFIKGGGVPTSESKSERAGLRAQGGSSANNWKSPKMSMRLLFRSNYGSGTLDPPDWLFQPKYSALKRSGGAPDTPFDLVAPPSDKINTLVLDAGLNYQWNHPDHSQHVGAVYYRDQFVSDLFLAMGWHSYHGVFVHLFINGLYWGVHGVHERQDDAFYEQYVGGSRDSFDVFRHTPDNAVAGSGAGWVNMVTAARAAAAPQAIVITSDVLDLPAFVDYMLLNFWADNEDWDFHNLYVGAQNASRRAEVTAARGGVDSLATEDTYLLMSDEERALHGPGADQPQLLRWRPTIWDAEKTFRNDQSDRTGLRSPGQPSDLHQILLEKANADDVKDNDYLVAWRDAVHRHMLEPAGCLYADDQVNVPRASHQKIAGALRSALTLDSARWGDSQHAEYVDKIGIYDAAMAAIKADFFDGRHPRFLAILAAKGLAPRVSAVSLVDGADVVAVNGRPAGAAVHCTKDGRDPRKLPLAQTVTVVAGAGLPVEPAVTSLVVCRALLDGEWSPPTRLRHLARHPPGYERKVVFSEIMYHPDLSPLLEFVEVWNANAFPVDLSLAECTRGLGCMLPLGSTVPAGGHFVVARHDKTYRAGTGKVPGAVWREGTKLSNDGESLQLMGRDGLLKVEAAFNDGVGWPAAADGDGMSLVISPAAAAQVSAGQQVDFTLPAAWIASASKSGSPGVADLASVANAAAPTAPPPTVPPPTPQPTPLPPGQTFAPTPQPTPAPPTPQPTPLPPGATLPPTSFPPPTFVPPQPMFRPPTGSDAVLTGGNGGPDLGLLAGAAAGGVLAIVLVAVVVLVIMRRQKSRQLQQQFFANSNVGYHGLAADNVPPSFNQQQQQQFHNQHHQPHQSSQQPPPLPHHQRPEFNSATSARSFGVSTNDSTRTVHSNPDTTYFQRNIGTGGGHGWERPIPPPLHHAAPAPRPPPANLPPPPQPQPNPVPVASSSVVTGVAATAGFSCTVCGNSYVSEQDRDYHFSIRH